VAHLVLIVGPPGSGRTTALEALAALGFATSDTSGMPSAALVASRGPLPPMLAVVIDLRRDVTVQELPAQVENARRAGHQVTVIGLDASASALLGRVHAPPEMAEYGLGPATLGDQRTRLRPLWPLADPLIDTTALSAAELREAVFRAMTRQPEALG
jgi:RNase adaptor protein for sRNA GlmZ degradation